MVLNLILTLILEETVGTQVSKMKPNRDKNPNCDILVYEREVLIQLQTCELSLTKPVNLPDECIVMSKKRLRKRILKLQSELGGNVAVHSKHPNRETITNANEGNNIIMETNDVICQNNRSVEDIPASTSESDTATIKVVEDNSGLKLPTDTYKTCTGNKISVTQTIIDCLDWKEVSSTEVEGVKEIEVEIRGKLKIKSSQEVLAMKDLRTDIILNLNN